MFDNQLILLLHFLRPVAITGIAFNYGDLALHLQNGNAVDVCYELDENVYNGMRSIQMRVADIKSREIVN